MVVTLTTNTHCHSHWVDLSEERQRPQAGGGFDGRKLEEGAQAPLNPCLDGRPPNSGAGSPGHFPARAQKALASFSLCCCLGALGLVTPPAATSAPAVSSEATQEQLDAR